MSKEKILLFSILIFSFLLLELFLRFISNELPKVTYGYKHVLYKNYTEQELSRNIPFNHKNYGGDCITVKFISKMQWHPRFGYNDKDINIDCVEKLFEEGKINIIFMGGSGMANYEAPNYLTSIEHYMLKLDDRFRSINLAEGGARLSNELSIFLEYVPKMKIKPDFIFFFDGYNEFNSIRYNGDPDDDFYWTAGVKNRIHNPANFYFDVIVERVHLIKFVVHNILNFDTTRKQPENIRNSKIIESADDYIYRKKILNDFCNLYKIKCVFILQPVFVLSKNLEGKTDSEINDWHNMYFKNDKKIYQIGFERILSSDKNIYNLTNILDNQSDTYFDYVHVNKKGIKIIGEKFRKILEIELKKFE